MSDFVSIDPALRAARMALDGLSTRQQAISRNLANVDTPGYEAQSYHFEEALQNAIKPTHSKLQLAVTNTGHLAMRALQPQSHLAARQGGSFRADGNNVDIDVELTEMTETGISYQALTQAASKKLALLKSIAMGR